MYTSGYAGEEVDILFFARIKIRIMLLLWPPNFSPTDIRNCDKTQLRYQAN